MIKLLVVLGEGGHSKEMLTLVDLLGDGYEYAYLLTREDPLSASKIQRPGRIYRVIRPRSKDDPAWIAACKLAFCLVQSLVVLCLAWPDAVISSGPAVAIPISFWAKLCRRSVIFVETGSRVQHLSLTGRLMRSLADLFFVQWPALQSEHPRAIYAGRLF